MKRPILLAALALCCMPAFRAVADTTDILARASLPTVPSAPESVGAAVPTGYTVMLVIALLAAVGALAMAYMAYSRLAKADKKLAEQAKKTAELQNEVRTFGSDLSTLRDYLQNLVNHLRQAQPHQQQAPRQQPQTAAERPAVRQQPQPARPAEKGTLYVSAPMGSEFVDAKKEFRRGETIFQIDYADSDGIFAVVDSPDAVAVARCSIAQFIEPACNIDGISDGNFTRIVTVKPGTVRKVGSTWKITQKAVVTLK